MNDDLSIKLSDFGFSCHLEPGEKLREWDDRSDTVKDLICRLLKVDPVERLTAVEALQHPFFQRYGKEQRHFSPFHKFRVIAWTVRASIRIYSSYRRVRPVTKELLLCDPYSFKGVRKLIDACAFRIYGHWVKKGEQQNRAALFENVPKAIQLVLLNTEGEEASSSVMEDTLY
ncbi:hypothetical protein E2320_003349 [Naja naja]|nr:hypothetical protein E2320_003349 [Naja naja]